MKDWTEELKEKLADHMVEPPQDLWADIEAALDQPKPVKRALRLAWLWAVAACALLLLGVALPMLKDEPSAPVLAESQLPTAVVSPEKQAEDQAETEEPAQPQTPSLPQTAVRPLQTALAVLTPKEEEKQPELNVVKEEPVAETAVKAEDKVAEATPQLTVEEAEAVLRDLLAQQEAEAEQPETLRRAIAFNVFASNIPLPSLSSGNDLVYFDPPMSSPGNPNGGVPGFGDSDGSNLPEEQTRSFGSSDLTPTLAAAHHKQPIKVGVSFSYPLTDRWSVEAGLTFSHHSSDLVYILNNRNFNLEQTLRYVGIPVGVRYQLYDLKSVGIYLTAGGAVEQCISAQREITWPEVMPTELRDHIRELRPQFSLFGGGGVQVSFTKAVALYLEPLLTYYIDNHSSTVNIYKDKPVNLDVRIGLRFNLK